MEELEWASKNGILSTDQYDIFVKRYNGWTYSAIVSQFKLSGDHALISCLLRTAQRKFWYPSFTGGNDDYLCDIDKIYFRDLLTNCSNEVNCVPTTVSIQLAFMLRKRRYKKALSLLTNINCSGLIHRVKETTIPCQEWIYEIVKSIKLKVLSPQELDQARRFSCDSESISNFFIQNAELFDRDERLIFNMDETMLYSKKKLKVIVPEKTLPLVVSPPAPPHITAVITICASGYFLEPLILLPNKKTKRNIESIVNECLLASTPSGWMNKDSFILYAILFCSQITHYRITLPISIRNDPILLIVDGHPSRRNYLANYIFSCFNVDLVVLPGHTSHVLQPFDLTVAAPLKSQLKINLSNSQFHIDNLDFNNFGQLQKQTAQQVREMLIRSFLDAHQKVCTPSNIKSGFEASGIFPLDPVRALQSEYAMPTIPENLKVAPEDEILSGKWANSEEMLKQLFFLQHGHTQAIDEKYDFFEIIDYIRNGDCDCIFFSEFPSILVETAPDKFDLINL